MTGFIIILATLATIAALTAVLARVVNGDGYGQRRRPPASHLPDIFDRTFRAPRHADL